MNNVKIYGAGSIGNHLAQASRRKGWDVVIADVDSLALERTRNEIYPNRYGSWDNSIKLVDTHTEDSSFYDLVIIGTPPDTHLNLAIEALKHNPIAILIEKPATSLDLTRADELVAKAAKSNTRLFVGYDHVVSNSVKEITALVSKIPPEKIITIDTEFREYWGGIFAAHPWLAGPWETYLGYSERGGGALAEHSHALNLWQYLARISGAGRIIEVQAMLDTINDGKVKYDRLSALHLKTENGLIGRCVQDVVTSPPKKWLSIKTIDQQYDLKFSPTVDLLYSVNGEVEKSFEKARPDDFLAELNHIESVTKQKLSSPIDFFYGLETMLVVKAAHLSSKFNKTAYIDYNKGFNDSAITLR